MRDNLVALFIFYVNYIMLIRICKQFFITESFFFKKKAVLKDLIFCYKWALCYGYQARKHDTFRCFNAIATKPQSLNKPNRQRPSQILQNEPISFSLAQKPRTWH